ncbi:MAG: mannose-1-phosphate guanylyltransferase [Anaerolineae bacterium]|nr:mannose-1-phosphate guanylyltransferase [Anaerolineae bacterium]
MYALIMAGGGGTRLWPHSRLEHPKQFVDLFRTQTLLQKAYHRITPLVPPENVYVVTGARYADMAREQLAGLPPENVIAEPAARNTAPAVGLGALRIRRRDPDATMIVLTADHLIRKDEHFRAALGAAGPVAETGALVTLGIHPTGPATGFGYIEQGEPLGVFGDGFEAYRVVRFTEKPDRQTAIAFFASERYHWNSGMFIWKVGALMDEVARQLPDLYAALIEIEAALDTPQAQATLERVWAGIKGISVDYGVMENARSVAVLPVDIGWSDVGSWAAIYDETADRSGANVVQAGELLQIDTEGCLVQSSKLIAAVGLRDLVIVDTEDVLMICPRGRAQDVRKLVQMLEDQGREELL